MFSLLQSNIYTQNYFILVIFVFFIFVLVRARIPKQAFSELIFVNNLIENDINSGIGYIGWMYAQVLGAGQMQQAYM